MNIEKEDVINALNVLKTMLKATKLNSHDVADLMIKELDLVDFVPTKKPISENVEHVLKFNKSFETLYNISMKMADECIGNKTIADRYSKLEEEFSELMEQLKKPILKYGSEELRSVDKQQKVGSRHYHAGDEMVIVNISEIANEMADVLFVLLHIAHKFGYKGFDLLHMASSKMLSRMNDDTYKAKN